jgi:hypothetical protein
MKGIALILSAGAFITGVAVCRSTSRQAADGRVPVAGIDIPPDYRDRGLISVAHEEGKLDNLRAILGNDAAINAARKGMLSYPDGSIIARLAWSGGPMTESEKAFCHLKSYMDSSPKNGIHLMNKDSKNTPQPAEGRLLDLTVTTQKM